MADNSGKDMILPATADKPERKGWEVKQLRCGAFTGEIQATEPVENYVATFSPTQSLTASVETPATDAESESEVHYLKRKLAYRDTEIEELKRQIESHRERENQPTPDKQTTDTEVQAFIKDVAYIMKFHAGRCPLDPERNYSGSEEHLAMYRRVMKQAIALQTYRTEPTSEEIRVALTWFSDAEKVFFERHVAISPHYLSRVPDKVVQTIIRALQQYRTEPCELCRHDLVAVQPFARNCDGLGIWTDPNFCPECGRPLRGDR